VELRRLYPEPGVVTVAAAVADLRLGDRAPPGRPYLVVNMVASADGRAALDGGTRGIGNAADRALFDNLRTAADAVLVGAGTARVERYGKIVRDAGLQDERRARGLDPSPLACIVSGRLDLPEDLPLLQDSESHVVLLTASELELGRCPATVSYLRGRLELGADDLEVESRELVLAPLLERLRSDHGVRSIVCEGGPTLNAALLREDLIDELFITLAPKLIGGANVLTILAGAALDPPRELDLIWALEAESHLFLRYLLRR